MNSGDLVMYVQKPRDIPARYLGAHGTKHMITVKRHGAHGRTLLYVERDQIYRPQHVIPTATHSEQP